MYDGTWDYSWKQGRQLATMSDGETTWTYTYDANGMRLSRSTGADADDVTYTYVYTDGLLSRMTKGDITLYFTYDAAGTPLTVSIHTGTYCRIKRDSICGGNCKVYYYVTNLQGDVVAILDASGNAVAEYLYNAWGVPVLTTMDSSTDLWEINPLRYRGYIYDEETYLYYLQSRYYDPIIGRFINADNYFSTGQGLTGNNMFAYCINNPVNGCDPCGTCFHRWDFWNDCDKCGGKDLGTKIDDAVSAVGSAVVSAGNAIGSAAVTAGKAISNAAVSAWNWTKGAAQTAWGGVKAAGKAVGTFVVDRFSTPEKASNTLSAIGFALDAAAAYCGLVAADLSLPTLGMSVPTAGTVAAILVVASLPFHGAALVINIVNEE